MSQASPHHKRIEDVFSGKAPDRYPVCEQAFASSVASAILGREAQTGSTELHFREGLAWLGGEQAHADFAEQVYQDTVALHRALDLDILYLPWRMTQRPTRRVDEFSLLYGDEEKGNWCVRRFDPSSRTYGVVSSMPRQQTAEALMQELRRIVADYRPGRLDPAQFRNPDLLRAVREYGDEFAVAGGSGMAVPMQSAWLETAALDPGLIAAWLDTRVEEMLCSITAQREAGITLINGGGDFAFNSGPVYSPDFFDSVMAPRWKRVFDHCRALDARYIMRSDGNLWPVAQTLFGECRPHAYYEIDYDAGMHFDGLRQAFPELVLFGNVSCRLLLRGTPEQVRAAALACLQAAAPRFVGASANSILHGTPPENVYALFDTIKRASAA